MASFSLVLVGLSPFITASIIIQLLTKAVPKLKELHDDGETGRRKIQQWTRRITVPLAIVQSIAFIFILRQTILAGGSTVLSDPTIMEWTVSVVAMTAGSVLLMWLGELITEQGVGNGISLLIFAGIVSQLPQMLATVIRSLFDTSNGSLSVFGWFQLPVSPTMFWIVFFLLLMMLIVLYFLVKINEAQRVITINYAKRVHGNSNYGGIKSNVRESYSGHRPNIALTVGTNYHITDSLNVYLNGAYENGRYRNKRAANVGLGWKF